MNHYLKKKKKGGFNKSWKLTYLKNDKRLHLLFTLSGKNEIIPAVINLEEGESMNKKSNHHPLMEMK